MRDLFLINIYTLFVQYTVAIFFYKKHLILLGGYLVEKTFQSGQNIIETIWEPLLSRTVHIVFKRFMNVADFFPLYFHLSSQEIIFLGTYTHMFFYHTLTLLTHVKHPLTHTHSHTHTYYFVTHASCRKG